jgi:uncharacterized membrane protein YhhN
MYKKNDLLFILTTLLFFLNFELQFLSEYITKPLPVLFLLIFLPKRFSENRFIFLAFLFSLFGDIFLVDKTQYFIHGLLAFFIAHIFFVIHFWKFVHSLNKTLIFVICIYMSIFLWFILPHTADLSFAVTAYAMVISIMFIAVYSVPVSSKQNYARYAGLSFVISDSVLAYSLFINSFPYSVYAVMISYWSSQYLFYRYTVCSTKD